jgi:TolB-like protein
MLSWEEGRLENVKIIDLGLAKGVTEDTLSIAGSFIGTPAYASPEQFAGLGTDIRSDLYSLGVTLWEMLSVKPPFHGSVAELMDQHQHTTPPFEKLRDIPGPVMALLQVLLAKDPNQRFQTPAQMQRAVTKIEEAIASGAQLTPDELRSSSAEATTRVSKHKPRRQLVWRFLVAGFCFIVALIAWVFLSPYRGTVFNQRSSASIPTEKSIAVLPFENISPNKDDAYFADGVQDEILNNLAKIAALKVISRTSVMQYRPDIRRDLRQIASALGVANVLEGTVRREGNRVRVSTELINASSDNTIWADSYERDLSDIFAIQSEVAQTIATKLTARLSAEEKRHIEEKPTDNLEAYDLYLRAKELLVRIKASMLIGNVEKQLVEVISFLEQAVRLDPKFTLAYCASAEAHDFLFIFYDLTQERRALADAAMKSALRLQPDLPEVQLAYAGHLYRAYRDYDGARLHLAIARRGLSNNVEVTQFEANMDRRQGQFEKAIVVFNDIITRDPGNIVWIKGLADTLYYTRQFRGAEQAFDRMIELRPDLPILKARKPLYINFYETGDDTAVRSALAALPASMADDRGVLSLRLMFALINRNWPVARELIEKMKGGEDEGWFAYGDYPVPVGCYSILLARLEGEQSGASPTFAKTRERLNQKVQNSAAHAVKACLLSDLAVIDALLGQKEVAADEAKRAVGMLPISKDAFDGPGIGLNLAIVYAWTNESDLAFETLSPLIKTPFGIFYGRLKRDPYWEPLRKDPRFDKLLAELAPRD